MDEKHFLFQSVKPNPYTLAWIWFEYNCQLIDPYNNFDSKLSIEYSKSLRSILKELLGEEYRESIKYRREAIYIASRGELFETYHKLDEMGEFNFIHNFLNDKKYKL